MGGLMKGKCVPRASCALQWYQHQHSHQKEQDCDNLTQEQRRVAFHLWAAYGRAELLETSTEEYLMCPMLWCRESFSDFEMTLRHISSCPWLSNGWYWCPSCGRPEQFLEGNENCLSTAPYEPPHDSMHVDTPADHSKLISYHLQRMPQQKPAPLPPYGTSAVAGTRTNLKRSMLINDPVDQISGFPLPGSENPPTYDDAPGLEYIADPDSPPDVPFSFIRLSRNVHNDHLPPAPVYEYHDSMLSVEISSTESQVEDLRNLVHVFHNEWTRNLHLVPEYKAPHLASLFETGVHALEKCYQGMLPNNFDEVFALLHIACAMTYTMHGNDASYPWAEFFHDMLQWKDAIPDKREAWLLATAIKSLQAPQQGPVVLTPNYDCLAPASTTTTTSTTVRSICPGDVQSFSTVGAQKFFGTSRPPQTVAEPLPTTLIDTLKNGKVLHECSNFFTAFEHGNVAERVNNHSQLAWYQQQHPPYEHFPHTEEMIYKITKPLQAYMGIEAFHGCIVDVESQLRNGLLRCTREVEVFLLSSGRCASLSPRVYQKYLKIVTALCDNYMHRASRDWRETSYIADLQRFLIISLEIDNSRRRNTPSLLQQSIQPIRNFANGNQIYEFPASSMSTDAEALMNSPPSTMTSRTQLDASQSIFTDRSTHSPVTSPTTRSSFPSPTQAVDTVYCEYCPQSFAGADRKSNLKRHELTSKSCGKGRTFKCTVSGCESVYRRTDNLAKHLRKVHN